jgi:hypothetical protein
MYKRFAKELRKTKEDSSSESEQSDDQEVLEYPKKGSNRQNVASSGESADEASISESSNESDGIIETGTVTVDELEAGDEKVTRRPRRNEILLYQCSICPEKPLASLLEVKEHISSKVCFIAIH